MSSSINLNSFDGLDKKISEKTEDPEEWFRQFRCFRKANAHKLLAEQCIVIFESKVDAARASDVRDFQASYETAKPPPTPATPDFAVLLDAWNNELLDKLLIKMENKFKANSSLRSDRFVHQWMDMRQGDDESVSAWQARVKKLVRDFSQLTPAVIKPPIEIMQKFTQGLRGDLGNMTWNVLLSLKIISTDTEEIARDKYEKFVEYVEDADATMKLSDASNKSRVLKLTTRPSTHDANQGPSPRRVQKIKEGGKLGQRSPGLCFAYAKLGECPLGKNCHYTHMNAKKWMATTGFSHESARSQDIIRQFAAASDSDESDATPRTRNRPGSYMDDDSPSFGNIIGQSKRYDEISEKLDRLSEVVYDLLRSKESTLDKTKGPTSVDSTYTVRAVGNNGTTESPAGGNPPTAMKRTQPAYVNGFIGCCPFMTDIGIDASNEAPHTLISEAFFRRYIEPTGEILQPLLDDEVPKLTGAGCDEISTLGIINELDITFGSSKRRSPHISIKAIVLKGDFSCDVLLNADTIKKLGMVIDYSGEVPYIALKKLNPVLQIELGQEQMNWSVAEANSNFHTLPHVRKVTCVSAIFDLKVDQVVRSHTTTQDNISAHIQNVERDYSFIQTNAFPPIVLERALEVKANIQPPSHSVQEPDSKLKKAGHYPLNASRHLATSLAVLAITAILACCKLNNLNTQPKDYRLGHLQHDQGDYLDIQQRYTEPRTPPYLEGKGDDPKICVCGFGVIGRPSADVVTADCPSAPSKRSSTLTLIATSLSNLDDLNIGDDIIHTIGRTHKNSQVSEMQVAGENQQTPHAQFIHHISNHQASVLTWDLTPEVDFGTDAVQYITNNIGNVDSTTGPALKTPLGCTSYHDKSVMRSFDVKQSHLVAVQNSTDGPAYFDTCYADGRKVAKGDHELHLCIYATANKHTDVAAVIEKIATASYVDVRSSYFLGDSPWTQTASAKHGVQPLFF